MPVCASRSSDRRFANGFCVPQRPLAITSGIPAPHHAPTATHPHRSPCAPAMPAPTRPTPSCHNPVHHPRTRRALAPSNKKASGGGGCSLAWTERSEVKCSGKTPDAPSRFDSPRSIAFWPCPWLIDDARRRRKQFLRLFESPHHKSPRQTPIALPRTRGLPGWVGGSTFGA